MHHPRQFSFLSHFYKVLSRASPAPCCTLLLAEKQVCLCVRLVLWQGGSAGRAVPGLVAGCHCRTGEAAERSGAERAPSAALPRVPPPPPALGCPRCLPGTGRCSLASSLGIDQFQDVENATKNQPCCRKNLSVAIVRYRVFRSRSLLQSLLR